MRNLGGAIGIAACGTILNDRTNLHFLRLAEHLNTTNTAMVSLLQQVTAAATAACGGDAVTGPRRWRCEQLWTLTLREAQTQTYRRCLSGHRCCASSIATVMVPLMRKVTAPARPPGDAH